MAVRELKPNISMLAFLISILKINSYIFISPSNGSIDEKKKYVQQINNKQIRKQN